MTQGPYCGNCTMYLATIHELRNELSATKQKLEAAEVLNKEAECYQRENAELKAAIYELRRRFRESQEQEPVKLTVSIAGIDWPFNLTQPLYAYPIIPPEKAELLQRIAELEKQVKEGK